MNNTATNTATCPTVRKQVNDHNEPRPLDDLGMKKQDFHMLEKQEINT